MSRFPELGPAQWSEPQRRLAEAIAAGPRGQISGPFLPLLHSPGLTAPLQQVGEYLRFHSSLPAALREFAILIVARFWTAQFEWAAHEKLARAAGLDSAMLASLAKGRRPADMSSEQEGVYEFCTELHREHKVSDSSFAAVRNNLGEQGAIDLIGLCGYYTMISMVLNVAEIVAPEGESPLAPPSA
jgi:4-carboxymuconolactone decarboxylase